MGRIRTLKGIWRASSGSIWMKIEFSIFAILFPSITELLLFTTASLNSQASILLSLLDREAKKKRGSPPGVM